MKITKIRHAWPENKGFFMERPNGGGDEYILLHFWDPMNILSDEGMVNAGAGAFIVYDEHTPQRFYNYESDIVHDWMHITGDMGALLKQYGLSANHIYYPSDSRFISDTVHEMEIEFFAQKVYGEELLDIKLRELIARTARDILQGDDRIRPDSRLKRSLSEIRREAFLSPESEITVADMAKKANLSESRFYVVYKSFFGVSPAKDLILARIQRAKFLLEQNEYSVSEVAKLAGYASEYHFIRQFKQATGVTPGKYGRAK